tara:strand:+ start:1048 stop:1575 length:528 start_codon:yes stop_codon:yes gene_type:complete
MTGTRIPKDTTFIEIIKKVTKFMGHYLYEYGVSGSLMVFNILFLIFKITEKYSVPKEVDGVKKDLDEIKKAKPVLDWIFFILSILGVGGTIITVLRYVDKTGKTDLTNVILAVILAVINLFTGILLISQETNKIIIEIKKEILSTGVSVLNIVYYVIYTIVSILSFIEIKKRALK